MACVNATAVLYEGNAAPLAHAIAERLSTIEPLPNTDERALLPTTSVDAARALADHLAARAAGTVAVLGADQVVADLGGGFAALRPAVHLLATPDPAKLNVELPFPCVWLSPWSRADGIAPLRNSLVTDETQRRFKQTYDEIYKKCLSSPAGFPYDFDRRKALEVPREERLAL